MSEGDHGINILLAAWKERLAAGDLDGVVALVTEEAEFWSQGQPPLRGRKAVREAFAPFLARYTMHQEFHCEELMVVEDWGFMRGLEVNRLRPRDGDGETVVRQRAFSVIHRGRDGVWRFHRGMTNQPPEDNTGGRTAE